VALKVVSLRHLADPESRQRLLHEARAASALNHPKVVTVHEIGSARDVDFIAMELVEGRTLKETIPAKGLPIGGALDYAEQAADGLHSRHIRTVHRQRPQAQTWAYRPTPAGLQRLPLRSQHRTF